MNMMLEYVIVFIGVLVINYFMNLPNKKKKDKKQIPLELLYIKKLYGVNIKKINQDNFLNLSIFVNTFIISTIYIILMYLLTNWVLRIIIGIVLLILMIIICYGLIGRYYLKKEGEE